MRVKLTLNGFSARLVELFDNDRLLSGVKGKQAPVETYKTLYERIAAPPPSAQ